MRCTKQTWKHFVYKIIDWTLIACISIEIYYTTTLFLGTTTSQTDVKVVYNSFTTSIMPFQIFGILCLTKYKTNGIAGFPPSIFVHNVWTAWWQILTTPNIYVRDSDTETGKLAHSKYWILVSGEAVAVACQPCNDEHLYSVYTLYSVKVGFVRREKCKNTVQ